MIAVVIGAGELRMILHSPAPLTAFVISIAGPAAGHALSAAVVLATFNALIAQMMFLGRLYFSFGRDEVFNPRINATLALVHGSTAHPALPRWCWASSRSRAA
jgi:amino acid transporter